MKKRSLKFKLILGGILAVIIPLSVVGLFAINKSSTALIAGAKAQALQVAKNLATMTEMNLEQEIKLAREMAHEPLVKKAAAKVAENGTDNAMADLKALDNFLVEVFKEIGKDYDLMFFADAGGTIISDSMGGALRAKNLSIKDRDYFNSANSGKITIGEPVISKASGKAVFVVAIPLKTATGQPAGVFGTVIKMETLSEKITNIKLGETGYPFMANKTGTIIAHPKKDLILKLDLKTLNGMESITKSMMAQESGVKDYHYKGDGKIAGFAPVPIAGWSIAVTQNDAEFMAPVYSIRNFILVAGAIFLVITLITVLWFARSIVMPINQIIEGLNEGSAQVASASNEVASSSQSLAEGASEQAASIEETSASMEEMASMTQKNAENAGQADSLMKEANIVVKDANESMGMLIGSMEDISKASEETSKIIKTIDEISFQTNLLALNAAVEAARAGEAGAGFAVVADEVRNLAMRAAEAAKNTALLIEGTVKKVNQGSELVTKTNAAFTQVSQSTGKVGDIVAEISEASNEQSKGIEQVNIAITEMDKVVQQNAANAEESASASEEMNAQAEQVKVYVGELVTVITGGNDIQLGISSYQAAPSNYQAAPIKTRIKHQTRTNKINPEKLIPFDDDFKDF
jgi:methyl-accepting chemotaxis protein